MTPVVSSKRNEKKDSAYASGTFSIIPQSPTTPNADTMFLLKRMSSNNSVTPPSPSALMSPNLNRLLLRTTKVVTHSGSHPDLRSSYATAAAAEPRRAEFAGGLINIDNAIKPKNGQHRVPSSITTPSIASTSVGNSRWLGHQKLASSFISTFRQHKSEKDEFSYNYKLFTKATDISVANQLTWIEAELFTKIKVKKKTRVHVCDFFFADLLF